MGIFDGREWTPPFVQILLFAVSIGPCIPPTVMGSAGLQPVLTFPPSTQSHIQIQLTSYSNDPQPYLIFKWPYLTVVPPRKSTKKVCFASTNSTELNFNSNSEISSIQRKPQLSKLTILWIVLHCPLPTQMRIPIYHRANEMFTQWNSRWGRWGGEWPNYYKSVSEYDGVVLFRIFKCISPSCKCISSNGKCLRNDVSNEAAGVRMVRRRMAEL